MAGTIAALETQSIVQYEISPNRRLQTNGEDEIPDLMGPGKGDVYYGEGWTLALHTKYRLGIKKEGDQWVPDTAKIFAYDIMERENQYTYAVRDIEYIIANLEEQISAIGDPGGDQDKQKKKDDLEDARNTWYRLLNRNPAYLWQQRYVKGDQEANRANLEKFMKEQHFSDETGELLIFAGGGTTFEYSRKIAESAFSEYSTSIKVERAVELHATADIGPFDDIRVTPFAGLNIKLELSAGFGTALGIGTEQGYGASWESGLQTEQAVGFVLSDNDVGDHISTYVYEGPWGTPIFFTDPGSVTSSPWQQGTNKAVDLNLSLVEEPTSVGPFDYHDGAHYIVKADYTGQRVLETATIDAVIYAYPDLNPNNMTARFNGDAGDYGLYFDKKSPSIPVEVSLYPPAIDLSNSEEKEYSVAIELDFVEDPSQINRILTLTSSFADLRAPRATITAPYDGQRISPAVFTGDKKFKIEAFSDDQDLSKIQLEIRSKRTDGVWEPWRLLSGMVWEDSAANDVVNVVTYSDRDPVRREFTFDWAGDEIAKLGVGEYALRAVAQDRATRLRTDGSQQPKPNVDLDAPVVTFEVDSGKPTVLTTTPNYQARDRERIYRGELSAIFNDDMRAEDFSDRTFVVTDLLEAGEEVAGFVSYSPTLRKAIFVPVLPFRPNGFYRVEIKTDTEKNDGAIERGVHDLAGNPLDNEFMWTFRTKDAPFEETWSITLSATDGTDTDASNIAAVEYGALDGEDEKDARSVPALTSQLRLSFLNRSKDEFDRDIRPADGRLSHHWFFMIGNAAAGSQVTIGYKPSVKLTRVARQYQVIRLVEFDSLGNVHNVILLDPTQASINPDTGEILELEAYTYTSGSEEPRYFRLDVQKADLVATTFQVGSSGWKFFSTPITPQRSDPFVNLGDDIDPFQMYRYDTQTGGYKIYPLDLGEVSLQPGHGYFTRLYCDVEVDVGGSSNLKDVTLTLDAKGWHAIGNPFIKGVSVASLKVSNGSGQEFDFNSAFTSGLVEGTLYRWETGAVDMYDSATHASELSPWEGYWLKTKQDNITLTIPAPDLSGAQVALPPSYHPPMAPPVAASSHLPISSSQFALRLELTSDFSADVTTELGTRKNAQMGWDTLDQSEPPVLRQTVAAYFDHANWGDESGLYNRDYQPILKVGEQREWEFTVYTDKRDAEMTLSWEKAVEEIPGDVMLYFRRADEDT
jgi:hypothetical protein